MDRTQSLLLRTIENSVLHQYAYQYALSWPTNSRATTVPYLFM